MFTNVLVPLDQSVLAEHALGMAVAIAKECGAAIHLVMAQEPIEASGHHGSSWSAAQTHQSGDGVYLACVAGEIAASSSVAVSVSLVAGAPAAAIGERAVDVNADLIVMTSHGRTGFSRAWMGSVADSVVRDASVPVLIVRRVVYPVPATAQDVAPTGMYPLAVTDPEATRVAVDEANIQLEEIARRVRDDGVSDMSVDVVVSDATAKSILNIANAQQADVIAMATHGRGASRLLIGSVADKVLRGNQRPLLLYRPSGIPVAAGAVETLVEQGVV